MTNKEILHADLLDILFENRNKAYGAYALRKTYNQRLLWALGISLGISGSLSILMSSRHESLSNPFFHDTELTVVTDEPQKTRPKEREPSRPQGQPRTAQVKSSQIKIVEENTDVPDQNQLGKAMISTETVDGLPADETAGIDNPPKNNDGNNPKKENIEVKSTIFTHSEAQYPGGTGKFTEFLKKYLNTSENLEAREKRMVVVRFMVDVDGAISTTEIVQSGGEKYDREVIRVLRKMPKWIPAIQNGIKVAAYFTQTVTFIGAED